MNRLALGTVQFGLPYGIANKTGQVSRDQAKAMLQLASTGGIDTIDTAMGYGDSEACLGAIGVQEFKLVTKLPAMPASCADVSTWVSQTVTASLLRMDVNSVYGLLLHKSEQLLGPSGSELYNALNALKGSGRVQKIGVSIYNPNELVALTPQYRFDLVQAPFNLFDRRLLSTGWMHRLKDDGVEVHTRSAFLQGLLLMAEADVPVKFAPWRGLIRRWHKWLEVQDVSAVEACLAFPMGFPEIDRVVVGADSLSHLDQSVRVANSEPISGLPDLQCDDENLINPVNWNT